MTKQAIASEPRRRGRPTRKEAEALDREVLGAAAECFLTHGYDGTTMDAIAQRAGVTKHTIYQRHADKHALFRAVLEDRIANWSAASQQTDWMLGDTLEERLAHYARTILVNVNNPEVVRFTKLVEGSWGQSEGLGDEFRKLLRARMLGLLTTAIAVYAPRDGFYVSRPDHAAAMFLGMMQGFHLVTNESRHEDQASIEEFARSAVQIFLRGLPST